MRRLKRFSTVILFVAISITFSSEALAWGPRPTSPDGTTYRSGSGHTYQHQHRGGQAGAPLDGGLLALLAGAGAIYVAKRKKKKNAE